jgi:O-methyltransferase
VAVGIGAIGALVRRSRLRGRGAGAAQQPASDPVLAAARPAEREVLERALPHSMTGPARMLALIEAVRYCVARGIPGAFAECGVWRGGSVLAMILTLKQLGREDRDIHLFDTFEGMTEPTAADTSVFAPPALETWRQAERERRRPWGEVFGAEVFSEEGVRSLLAQTGYPPQRLHFVRGEVQRTLPDQAPERLALLRLDTDWYESTRHELVHLFPRLERGGVLIVDDYGHFEGARRAVDEYLAAESAPLLLAPIDYTGRIAVKH